MPKTNKSSDNEIKLKDLVVHLENIEGLIRENNLLLRILVQPILWSSLKKIFVKPQQLWAYELSDGKRSTRDIGKIVSVDQKTISTWWRTWADDYEVVEKVGKRGQFKGRYSLLELVLLHSPSGVEDVPDSDLHK